MATTIDTKLAKALGIAAHPGVNTSDWASILAPFMLQSGISNPKRIAAFIAQVGIESAGFSTLEENLNYSAERLCQVWPSHFDSPETAAACAHNPQLIANAVYCERMGNGGLESNDGWKFRGAGLLQLTGRANHTAFATAAKVTVDTVGDFLRTPRGAAQGACWFWISKNLNAIADGWFITAVSRIVNGGTNGLQERIDLSYKIFKAIS